MSVSSIPSSAIHFSGASSKAQATGSSAGELTEEEKKQINELKKRDREVRAHEMAHAAAGGACVRGGASFEFQTGPDRQKYAVGGEVSIDTSPVRGDPAATIKKMQVVKRAALSPSKPSAQDRSVAAAASVAESQARQELQEMKKSDSNNKGENKNLSRIYTKKGIMISANSVFSITG